MGASPKNSNSSIHRCLIATTEPILFRSIAFECPNVDFRIHNNSDEIFTNLTSESFQYFIADYRQLTDRWTGQRFLKYLRERREFDSLKFWLMAESWHPQQEALAVKSGAIGMVQRSVEAILKDILVSTSHNRSPLELELSAMDELFATFAGPMSKVHIELARNTLQIDRIEHSAKAYGLELARHFSVPDRRELFLEAIRVQTSKPKLSSRALLNGDTAEQWLEKINAVFRTYAGALGARLIIEQSMRHFNPDSVDAMNIYFVALTNGLTINARQLEFVAAAKAAGLAR
jgi:hypothetical protein